MQRRIRPGKRHSDFFIHPFINRRSRFFVLLVFLLGMVIGTTGWAEPSYMRQVKVGVYENPLEIPVKSHTQSGLIRTVKEKKNWLKIFYTKCAKWRGILGSFFGNLQAVRVDKHCEPCGQGWRPPEWGLEIWNANQK